MTGAIVGGVTGALASHPIDFIKTKQQGDIEKTKYRGFFHTGSALYKEHGVLAFYRGAGFRCAGIIVASFMIPMWKDILGPLLFPHAYTEEKKL